MKQETTVINNMEYKKGAIYNNWVNKINMGPHEVGFCLPLSLCWSCWRQAEFQWSPGQAPGRSNIQYIEYTFSI